MTLKKLKTHRVRGFLKACLGDNKCKHEYVGKLCARPREFLRE